ncbi:SIR2 family protein [Mycobacterium sp. SA01]|uniref:SIR2 family protein n=1 Tax=Mycobacterium sp. SA01 TaxID=3238820 RepID=UPI00351B1AC6
MQASDESAQSTTGRSYRRDPSPFFKRHRTNRLIDQLAAAPDLTIYAGAGVTIDQGGLSWSQLVHRVAMSTIVRANNIVNDTDIRMLGTAINPLEAATAILQHFQKATGENFDQNEANDALISCIGYSLYPGARWNGGELARGIATVALVRAVNGMKTRIITTNYDTLLEANVSEQRESFVQSFERFGLSDSVPELAIYCLGDDEMPAEADALSLIYLHGRISTSPTEPARGDIAFTEIDYAKSRSAVSTLLYETFKYTPLLILGASLTDPPLIAALQDTTPQTEGKQSDTLYHRVALLPIPAIQEQTHQELNAEETQSVCKQQVARMKALGVELLVPDFYSSVAQFCDELDCSMYRQLWGPQRPKAIVSPYWDRLSAWWDDWYHTRYRNRARRRALDRYLRLFLTELAADILEATGRKEDLKVELWCIWDPSEQRRTMRLWASSGWPRSQWDDGDIDYLEATSPIAEITRECAYPAVRALIEGHPRLSDAGEVTAQSSVDNPHVSRWRTFLAVPISVSVGYGRNAVGAVTLASMAEESHLNASQPALLDKCVRRMRHIGQMSLGLSKKTYSTYSG